MPGNPLNLVYPTVGEATSTAVAKLIAMFQVLQADIEAKILPSEFSWTSDLTAQGHSLSNLSKIQLDNLASAAGLPTGTVYMQSGDIFVQTASGAVRLTLNGQINASGLGGISGDFGGSNPARVTYTDLTDTYTFTADTNDYSELECQSVKLRNNGNWTTVKADPATSTAQAWTLGAQNTSGIALLRQSNTGIVQSTGTVTEPITMSESITFTGAGKIKHGNFAKPMYPVVLLPGAVTWTNAQNGVTATAGANGTNQSFFEVPQNETWKRFISVTVYFNKTTAGTLTIGLYGYDASTALALPTLMSLQPTTNVVGNGTLVVGFTVAQTFNANMIYTLGVQPAANTDVIRSVAALFDSV